jgi:hypothetical protein
MMGLTLAGSILTLSFDIWNGGSHMETPFPICEPSVDHTGCWIS